MPRNNQIAANERSNMSIWRLLTRLVVGGFVFGHGTQKLFGWFGGAGIEGTAKGFEKAGLRPGPRNAVAAGLAETGGGALLVTGLATPLGATLVTGTMLTAIEHVHRDKDHGTRTAVMSTPSC